jgi:tetratricopeptide (TPR) repeat protein
MTEAGMLTLLCERWEEARSEGREVTPEELCRDAPELLDAFRREVAALEAADDRMAGPRQKSLLQTESTPQAPELPPGCRYRIDHFLAQGGLGQVFVAHDDELHRKVALKFIRPGKGRAAALVRFRREAEVTSRLQEGPGILPVYGLVELPDRSFCYAMRLLQGETLESAIGSLHANPKSSDGTDRFTSLLRHFAAVCRTVAFAHDEKILHRDIKPENVWIGKYRETWLIDWGLAREFDASDPQPAGGETEASPSNLTGAGVVGTPGYISPEQQAGTTERVGPWSDIYALGAMLGVIMTGNRPPVDPPAVAWPSGDKVLPALAAVCRKAMAHDPAQRYPSAKAFADEVDAWIANEPISAYREPAVARAARWLRRHRLVATALIAVVLASTIASLGWAGYLSRVNLALSQANKAAEQARNQAEDQRDEANRQYRLSLTAGDQMLTQVGERLRTTQDVPAIRRDVLKQARAFYDTLLLRREVNLADRRRAGEAYIRLAIAFFDLGDYTQAEQTGKDAVALWANDSAEPIPDWLQHDRAEADRVVGSAIWHLNRQAEALACFDRAASRLSALMANHPEDEATRVTLAEVLIKRAGVRAEFGHDSQAASDLRAAIQAVEEHPPGTDPIGRARQGAAASGALALLLARTGRASEGLDADRNAVARLRPVVAEDPQPLHRAELSSALDSLGVALRKAGQVVPARAAEREALTIDRQLAADFPAIPRYTAAVADDLNDLAVLEKNAGQIEVAQGYYDEAVTLLTSFVQRFPQADHQARLARVAVNSSMLLTQRGQWPAAESCVRAAIGAVESLVAENPGVLDYDRIRAVSLNQLGAVLNAQGKPSTEAFSQAIEAQEAMVRRAPNRTDLLLDLADMAMNLSALKASSHPEESLRWVDRAIAALERANQSESTPRGRDALDRARAQRATLVNPHP